MLKLSSTVFKEGKSISKQESVYILSSKPSMKQFVDLFSEINQIPEYIQPFFEKNNLVELMSPQQAVITVGSRYFFY